MFRQIYKKIFRLIFVILGVTILTFSLIYFVPGNPAEIILGQAGIEPTKQEVMLLEEKMGLNKPIHIQYTNWIVNVLKGDLGKSYVSRENVIDELVYRFPKTLELTFVAFIIMTVISFSVGIFCALYKNSIFDYSIKIFSFLVMAIPSFWLGFILIYKFSLELKILPVAGSGTVKHIILPAVVLALPMIGKYIRLIRISFLEALEEEYVYSLRAKGIKEQIIVINNVMKNALISIIPSIAISIGGLIGGSVIVENIFAWPGLGSYLVSSIMNRDFPVVQGYVLLMGIMFVIINFIADLLIQLLNPKNSYERSNKV
ncbi:MAG: nickel ABC transporter permease [Sarcina sp.]